MTRSSRHSDLISSWAHQLGLAASPLFGGSGSRDHFALLDGRRGSFACSEADARTISLSDSRDWQWSADLAHHVILFDEEVIVRSGKDSTPHRFDRTSVETRLEEFHSFLDNARRNQLPDVVPFLVDEFLQLWATLPVHEADGINALGTFLLALQAAGESDPAIIEDATWRSRQEERLGLDAGSIPNLSALSIERAVGMGLRSPLGLKLVPSLVLRHAAGRLFQEAHAYLEAAQLGLWGDATVKTVPTLSPTGAYFTPLPIARLLAESALMNWTVLPDSLSIADFACGSAVFLCEALRELERRGYRGKVHLIGRDVSTQAVVMARVAISTTAQDLTFAVTFDIQQCDMVEVADWPKADVILMNPPFRSWEKMPDRERQWLRESMPKTHRGRPDLSVGFVEHALQSLKDFGVLATLIPAGLLASESLGGWRDSVSERSTPSLIGVLGEHGLFRHALVNVGILVLHKDSSTRHIDQSEKIISVAWAAPEPGAASQAIRALRRLSYTSQQSMKVFSSPSWSVSRVSLASWNDRVSWLPGPGLLGLLLDRIKEATSTRVEDLFNVRQGIRTGARGVFVIPNGTWSSLPRSERKYFRPVVDAVSFVDGTIVPQHYLFVPDPAWNSEADLLKAVPTFHTTRLLPAKDTLKQRKGIDPHPWWHLTRARGWSFESKPRLLSKRFGLYPAFALDLDGDLAVVQANAWIPTSKLEDRTNDLIGLLTAYWWLLNSRVMVALFREYCPNVSGGQFDLERKYVRHVPLPDLARRMLEDPGLQAHATLLSSSYSSILPPIAERDTFAALAFGTSVSDWPVPS